MCEIGRREKISRLAKLAATAIAGIVLTIGEAYLVKPKYVGDVIPVGLGLTTIALAYKQAKLGEKDYITPRR